MSQRNCSVFVSLLLATAIAAPTAHAVCRSPKHVCKHIDDCLQTNKNDAERLRVGVRTRNGRRVWAAAEACAHDLGRKTQWVKGSRECSDVEYISIANADVNSGEAASDLY